MDFKAKIADAIAKETTLEQDTIITLLEIPPDPTMGDYAFPCFSLAKEMKKTPVAIAEELAKKISFKTIAKIEAKGPYLNFFIDKAVLAETILTKIQKKKLFVEKKKEISLVEGPGPNTNKPLHLGHIRNGLITTTTLNLLKKIGHEVHHVDIINDRGIHICKSMLAYQKFGKDDTPEKSRMKSDHFVGKYYVLFSQKAKEDPSLEEEAKKMLVKWEQGDKEIRALWRKMNAWACKGMFETYKKLGLNVEKAYYESNTYQLGKSIIMQGLRDGLFKERDDNAIVVDLTDKKLDEKILLRPDGTSVYITQDIGMINERYKDFAMDRMVYVVANEQNYHFNVLFEIFKLLKYPFAEKCYHLSYGMVALPEGKMKSREGTVVDADDLIKDMIALAREEVKKRYASLDEKEVEKRAEMIGMAGLRFFFLKYDAAKDFVFNPKESLSFEGETGPYVQYAYARICSILEKHGKSVSEKIYYASLKEEEERNLINLLGKFENVVYSAADHYKPHLISRYLLDLAQSFNEYYHKHQILKEEDDVKEARLFLIVCVKDILKQGLALLGIDAPEKM